MITGVIFNTRSWINDMSPKAAAGTATPKTGGEVEEFFFGVSRSAAGFDTVLKRTEPQISTTQWALLRTLRDSGELRPFDIARRIGISRQLVNQASRKLDKLGLLEVIPAEEGRKAVQLRLSAAGARHLKNINGFFEKFAKELTSARPAMKFDGPIRVLGQVPMLLGKNVKEEPAA